MKLLTLIEDAHYPETTFAIGKKRYKTRFAPIATSRARSRMSWWFF